MQAHSHCHFCGHQHTQTTWPRTCSHCQQVSYCGPSSVAVLIAPVEGGKVVLVERNIGEIGLAFPGGFIEHGEDWKDAAVRELKEETGIVVPQTTQVLDLCTLSTPSNLILVFGVLDTPLPASVESTADGIETTAVVFADVNKVHNWNDTLIFGLHAQAAGIAHIRELL